MTNQTANHNVDLRQTGQTLATIICADDGRALDLKPSLDDRCPPALSGLDVYESNTQLKFDSMDEKGAAVFQNAEGKVRLVLPPGKLGSMRVAIEDRSAGESRGLGLKNSDCVCVRIEPLP